MSLLRSLCCLCLLSTAISCSNSNDGDGFHAATMYAARWIVGNSATLAEYVYVTERAGSYYYRWNNMPFGKLTRGPQHADLSHLDTADPLPGSGLWTSDWEIRVNRTAKAAYQAASHPVSSHLRDGAPRPGTYYGIAPKVGPCMEYAEDRRCTVERGAPGSDWFFIKLQDVRDPGILKDLKALSDSFAEFARRARATPDGGAHSDGGTPSNDGSDGDLAQDATTRDVQVGLEVSVPKP